MHSSESSVTRGAWGTGLRVVAKRRRSQLTAVVPIATQRYQQCPINQTAAAVLSVVDARSWGACGGHSGVRDPSGRVGSRAALPQCIALPLPMRREVEAKKFQRRNRSQSAAAHFAAGWPFD
jgi:hypothetical protein